MANLMDYLDWRGDLPFSAVPFCEVDNLILAELAYTDFAGVVPDPESGEMVSIQEACSSFWSIHTREEVEKEKTLFHLAPMLLEKMAASRRFAQTRLSGYVNVVSAAENEQMSALTFHLEDGTVYVAYRGTDDTLAGWKEDFTLSFLEETPGQKRAAEYLNDLGSRTDSPLRVGGHSKGGNFAVYASAFCHPEVKARIREVYSNDGPGFLETVTAKAEYQEILPRVISIIPEESLFGLLLDSGYPYKVIRSSRKGVWQHDALSWEVLGGRFVEAPSITPVSAFMEMTLDKWISGIAPENRKAFVDSLFDVVYASGAEQFSSLQEDRLKKTFDMLKSFRSLEPEGQKRIWDILGQLARTGKEVLMREWQKQEEEKREKKEAEKRKTEGAAAAQEP